MWWRSGRDAAGASRQCSCLCRGDGAAAACVLRDASRDGDGGRVPAKLVFDAARRALTNCLKGWTITALTSDMVAALAGRCGRCRYYYV